MRAFVLAALVSCASGAAPVTLAPPNVPPPPAHVSFRDAGRVERELGSLLAEDDANAATRPARYAREMELFAQLARCSDARSLAGEIDSKGDEADKRAARDAIAECDRLARKPTPAEIARMRAAFRQARRLEEADPRRAVKLYEEAWGDAPSVAAMLGVARAARASGDGALAERSFERALGFVESRGAKARVAVTLDVAKPADRFWTKDVRNGAATLTNETSSDSAGFFLRQDLATGALRVLADIPMGFSVASATNRFALLAAKPLFKSQPPRLFEIGVDDELTAVPLDDLTGADQLALSAHARIAASRAGRTVSVVDPTSRALLGKITFAGDATWLGVTADDDVVVRESNVMCVLSPPSYASCRSDPALVASVWDYPRPVVAGSRIAFAASTSVVRVYDVHGGRVVRDLPGNFLRVAYLSLSPDGKSLITTSHRGYYVWDLATGTHVVTGQLGSYGRDYEPVWTDDSKRVIVQYDALGSQVYTLPGAELAAAGSLPSDSLRFAFGRRGALWIAGPEVVSRVDFERGTLRTFVLDDGGCDDLAVSPDESLFAVRKSTSTGVEVFDATGKRLASPESFEGALRFDGRDLVGTDGANETVLDVATQKLTTRAASVRSKPEDRWKATTRSDGLIEITDTETHATRTLELGAGAFVLSADGKITIGGDASSAGCRVGAAWLPLDACRDRFSGAFR